MSTDNPPNSMRKIVSELRAKKKEKKSRANSTFHLEEPQASIFKKFCRDHDYNASEIVDKLLKSFLEEVKNELLPDPPAKGG